MVSGSIGIFSHIVTDEIFAPDGSLAGVEVGGAGAFAAVGAALASRSDAAKPVLFAGAGSHDVARLSEWLSERGVDPSGLFVHGEFSPVTEVRYAEDGERVEIARHGLEHFLELAPYPKHAAQHELSGAYVFRDLDPGFWRARPSLRSLCTGPILWELHADICAPQYVEEIVEIASEIDVLSLNRTEARLIMDGGQASEIFDLIPSSCDVVLRMGADGSLVRSASGVWRVGTSPTPALDPTGGGNSWSGALVASLAQSGDILQAAKVATATAAVVIAGPGAPVVTQALRESVERASGVVPAHRVLSYPPLVADR